MSPRATAQWSAGLMCTCSMLDVRAGEVGNSHDHAGRPAPSREGGRRNPKREETMSGPQFRSIDVHKLPHAHHEAANNEQAVSRRRFLAGTGAAAVAASGAIGLGLAHAEAVGLNLPSELAEGTRAAAV